MNCLVCGHPLTLHTTAGTCSRFVVAERGMVVPCFCRAPVEQETLW